MTAQNGSAIRKKKRVVVVCKISVQEVLDVTKLTNARQAGSPQVGFLGLKAAVASQTGG